MDIFGHNRPIHSSLTLSLFTACLLLAACGGSGGDDDDSQGSADTTISITETFNLDAGASVLKEAHNQSQTNGNGIGAIITASASSPQPSNGYTASTVDITNTTNNTLDTLDFATNGLGSGATAAQLAAFFETQNNYVEASASTNVRLNLSSNSVVFGDQLSINGVTITGDTRSEVMSTLNALPDIVASIDNASVIAVTATDGNDLRIDLNNAAPGQTISIESIQLDASNTVTVIDSATIGDGLPNTKATIGGVVNVTLEYPLLLTNAGSGNIFGATIPNVYFSQNEFDADDPDTYNHASAVGVVDSLGNNHTMVQYFVKQDDLAGTQPNRWAMYVMIDGKHLGSPDTNGQATPASFQLVFDSNGQLDTNQTDPIAISQWIPLNDEGNPNGAASVRITIGITGSTQFGGEFALTNVQVN